MMWDLKVWPFNEFLEWILCRNMRTHVATTTFDGRSDFPPSAVNIAAFSTI